MDDFSPTHLLHEAIGEHWLIQKILGSGGMSWVYQAQDQRDASVVAVKVLPTNDPARQRRFLRESRILESLQHPNIVTYRGSGYCPRQELAFITMEHLEAPTFDTLLQTREERSFGYMVYVLLPVLEALQYMHSKNIVHRDLKPSNISADPHRKYLRLFDFGISKDLSGGEGSSVHITLSEQVCGSPHFLAPEQICKETLGPYTDLYAFGVMLYWVLTGQFPFQGKSVASLCNQHIHAPVPNVYEAWALDTPPHSGLIDLTRHLLSKRPSQRPGDAHDVFRRLVRLIRGERSLLKTRLTPPRESVKSPLHQLSGPCDSSSTTRSQHPSRSS